MASRSNLEVRTYGTPTGGQAPGTVKPKPARNTVGMADPSTRRRLLDQRLKETEPLRVKAPPRSRATPAMGVSPNAARLLRDRGSQIDREVTKRSR